MNSIDLLKAHYEKIVYEKDEIIRKLIDYIVEKN